MAVDFRLGGLRIVRPLLGVPGCRLREELAAAGWAWREDASNAVPSTLRNRVRPMLQRRPELRERLLALGQTCAAASAWAAQNAPVLAERFAVEALVVARPLARRAAARWLRDRGAPADRVDPDACERLILLATDAASPARQMFPGGVAVRRRGGFIFAEMAAAEPVWLSGSAASEMSASSSAAAESSASRGDVLPPAAGPLPAASRPPPGLG
jgi:hypothetical protein